MNSEKKLAGLSVILFLSGMIVAMLYGLRGSVVIEGLWYPMIFDDALISLRYARNLTAGAGWVWNPGDPPLEGFTNLGWVLLATLPHHLFDDPRLVAWWIWGQGAILHGVLVVCSFWLGHQLAGLRTAILTALTTMASYPVIYWSMSGLEVPLIGVLLLCGFLSFRRHGPSWPLLGLACGGLVLTRPDGVVLVAGLYGAALLIYPWRGAKPLLVLGLVLGFLQVGILLWRWTTFASFTPNTYLLKMTGFPWELRLARGAIQTLWQTGMAFGVPLVLTLTLTLRVQGIALLKARGFGGRFVRFLPLWVLVVAYSSWVGGDAWEGAIAINRFILPILPTILVTVFALLISFIRRQFWLLGLPLALIIAVWVSVSPTRNWPRAFLQMIMVASPPGSQDHHALLRLIPLARELFSPSSRVAVASAGTLPFYLEFHAIDLLGKCDAAVARTTMHRNVMTTNPLLEFFPGHLKWDYDNTIGVRAPDFIVSQWGRTRPWAKPHLEGRYELVKSSGGHGIYRRIHPVPHAEP
jgi:hypothetical protein